MAAHDPPLTDAERERIILRHANGHPLEMFPWFRRWTPGLWRDLLYTLIWNTGFMAVFALIGMVATLRLPSPAALWVAFVIAQCVGYTLHGLFALGGCTVEAAIRRRGRLATTLYYMATSTVGVVAGFAIGTTLLEGLVAPLSTDLRWFIAIGCAFNNSSVCAS